MFRNVFKLKFLSDLSSVLFLLSVFFSASALSAASYLEPSRIVYQRPNAAAQLELINCFTTGNCTQENRIQIYPMPCEGSGTSDCTGCYRLQGGIPIRVDDLNSAGTCAGRGDPNEQKLRVFVGYEQSCPSGTPVGSTCSDGQLLLSCRIVSEGVAGVGDSVLGYNQDCFSGRPYVRRAKAPAATVTVLPSSVPVGPSGCGVGTTGTYPYCVPCSDSSYKSTTGNASCTQCAAPIIEHSENIAYTTAGTTKSSANDCRVDNFTCMNGYIQNTTTQSCDLIPPPPPSPTPTPSPSPAPSPTPVPSPSPGPACSAAQAGVNFGPYTYQHTPITDPPQWNVGYNLSWNQSSFPVFPNEDYVVMSISVLHQGEQIPILGFVHTYPMSFFRIYSGAGGSISGGAAYAGDTFIVNADFHLNGEFCPRVSVIRPVP